MEEKEDICKLCENEIYYSHSEGMETHKRKSPFCFPICYICLKELKKHLAEVNDGD